MSNYEKIGTLYDTADKLIGIRYSIFETGLKEQNWIDSIEMRFQNDAVATIYIESEFDTLRLELGEMVLSENCSIKVATSIKPWNEVIGSSVAWMWLLRNQQGYEDGLRFEFSSKNHTTITLLAIASRIEIFVSQIIN